MAKKIQKKLTVELVPKTCHFSNARTMIKPKEWDKLRFMSYEKAGYVCEICSQTGLEQGYKHFLECHEVWEYDDKLWIQKLIGLVSLCPICHLTKHIGRANAMGKQHLVFNQLERVNKWNHKQVVEHVAAAFTEYVERSKHPWLLDITLLAEDPFNIIVVPKRKRIFKKTRTYKKRKK